MAVQLFANNVASVLAASLPSGTTGPSLSLQVSTGTGDRFPAPTGGDYFLATVYEKNNLGAEINHEIVKITGRTGDVMTISDRDFEGTVGVVGGNTFPDVADNPSGVVYVEIRWTAYAATNTLQATGNLEELADAAVSRTNLGLGSIVTQNANNVAITGGTMSGVSISTLDANTTFEDDADPTKKFKFQASGITAGQTRTLSVPDADITVVGTATTQTLTNKTLNLSSNTLTGTLAQFNTALSDADFATTANITTAEGNALALAIALG